MIIGIMGDTHDHLPNIRKAVAALSQGRADIILHTGDYIAPFVIPEIAGAEVPVVGVFGNNDGDCPLLLTRCREQGNIEIRGYFAELECDGQKIALLHGHDREKLSECVECGMYDLVVHGHTHRSSVTHAGSTLCINPGEVCGYLTENPSLALYETEDRTARLIFL